VYGVGCPSAKGKGRVVVKCVVFVIFERWDVVHLMFIRWSSYFPYNLPAA
jgi:hypothetical protein